MSARAIAAPSWLLRPEKDPNGLALAISGGGFRATLFHLGVTERLHQLGVLQQISYLSSVSGGTVLAAVLARAWPEISGRDHIASANFARLVVEPIVNLVKGHVRDRALRRAFFRGELFSGRGEALVDVMADLLFGNQTMGELPAGAPMLALNAASLRTGKRFRFSRLSMGDYHMGYTAEGQAIPLARAVVASAAFPPVFAPVRVDVRGPLLKWTFGANPECYEAPVPRDGVVSLVDGGVYENIGLQAAKQRCSRVIAVDAGFPPDVEMPPVEGVLSTAMRSIDLMMSQIVNLPVSQFVGELQRGTYSGCFMRISHTVNYLATAPSPEVPALTTPYPALSEKVVKLLARLRTDLNSFSDLEIDLLRFHGATVADVSLRRFQSQLVAGVDAAWTRILPVVEPADEDLLRAGAARPFASVLKLWQGC